MVVRELVRGLNINMIVRELVRGLNINMVVRELVKRTKQKYGS